MVDIQVSGVMGVDRLRMKASDELFDDLHDVEQRHCIETVVGEFAEHKFFGTDLVGSLASPRVKVLKFLRIGIFPLRITRRHALREYSYRYIVAFTDEARHRAATA